MEHKYTASADKVFALLTNPKWLEERSLALGELSATVKAKKAGEGVTLTMNRRVKRDLPALVSKVLKSESDLVMVETWMPPSDDGSRKGTITMDILGQPVKMTAKFELTPAGKGCVYKVTHVCKSGVPLIGGAVEKFALGQIEAGASDELVYLATALKKTK